MIDSRKDQALSRKPISTKARNILVFILLGILALSFHNCRSLHVPRKNEFINESNWKRSHFQKLAYHSTYLNLFLYSEKFAQAKVIYIEIIPIKTTKDHEKKPLKDISQVELLFNNKNILLCRMGWGYRGFLGIHPNQRVGKSRLALQYVYKGRSYKRLYSFFIKKTKFKTYKKRLLLAKYSDIDKKKRQEVQERVAKESQKKQKIFKIKSENKINYQIAHPRNEHYITSDFWVKRMYLRYRYRGKKKVYYRPRIKYHRGLDLRGRIGAPIYALAKGEVILADKMYYEGYFTVIDHGNNIFSGYMHQSRLKVYEGENVDAGEKIGLVGNTGSSTGPHLHVFLKIQGVHVDPLSMLALPIRD